MANAPDEEEDYEAQLTDQVAEQREALLGIDDALAGGHDDELAEMRTALIEAIDDLEKHLLEMKRGRLLAMLEASTAETTPSCPEQASGPTPLPFPVGSLCRFRYSNGCWYHGCVQGSSVGGNVVVLFTVPTRRFMLNTATVPAALLRPHRVHSKAVVCGRSAFARPRLPQQQIWERVSVLQVDRVEGGASVTDREGRTSTLSLDDLLRMATAPCPDADEGADEVDSISGEDHPSSSGVDDTSDGNDNDDDDDIDGDGDGDGDDGGASCSSGDDGRVPGGSYGRHRKRKRGGDDDDYAELGVGLGLDVLGHARLAAASGPQTSTIHFAGWEAHTRGIASKLLAGMGYVGGTGLGASGSGISVPLEVTMLPNRRGLGGGKKAGAGDAEDDGGGGDGDGAQQHGKKRRKRKSRRQKEAAQRNADKEERRDERHQEELRGEAPGLFAFINNQLGDHSEAAAKMKALERSMTRDSPRTAGAGALASASELSSAAGSGGRGGKGGVKPKDDRMALIRQQEKIVSCRNKIGHFQAMLARNKDNRALSSQVNANIAAARDELAAAEAEQRRMAGAVSGNESRSKFWSKF